MAKVGDGQLSPKIVVTRSNNDQNVISTETVDVDGGKVGDAAQFSAGLGLDVDLAERFSFDSDIFSAERKVPSLTAKNNPSLPFLQLLIIVSYPLIFGLEVADTFVSHNAIMSGDSDLQI